MNLLTNDGRPTTVETMRAIFEEVCQQMMNNLVPYAHEFNWKERISFEEEYVSADRTNDVMSAIDFMVAGKTEVHVWMGKDRKVYCQYLNKGYYANGC